MEYNDNDYEGNNLHLAGEESSKISSTLRPFVLPKFDFDDNIHGNLRFDSLVDNEVFLGIPSQDDNHWIEDFSKGSSGIRFCSSATVSCALPRFNNVWSEATSSESVEMLLKAVGQEEMIPGESIVEESDLGDQMDSMGQMGTSVRQDDKIDDVDGVNPLLPPAEAEQSFSMLNKSDIIEDVPHEAEEQNLSSYGVSVDDKENSLFVTGSNLSNVRGTCEDKGERHELANDSLSEQVQEKLSVSDTGIDNGDSSCQEHAGMLMDQDNISEASFVSSNFVSTGIDKGVNEQKEDLNANDETLGGNTVQTANSEQVSPEFPPVADFLNQDHLVEIQVNNFGKTSCMPEKRESVYVVEDCGKVAFDVEPAADSGCSDGADIKGSDDTPKICVNIKLKQVSVTQLSDQTESHAGDEDIYPGSSSSLEAPLATFESSVPCKSYSDHANDPDNSLVSSFAGELGPENSGIERMSEVHTENLQKDSLDKGGHVSPPLLDGNKQTCGEDCLSKQADDDLSMQADVQRGDLAISACEKDDKLPAGACNVVPDDHGKEGFEFSGEIVEVNVESSTASQSSASAGDYQVLSTEVEYEKLKSSCPDAEVLADCRVHNSPSIDMGYSDQNTELDAAIQPSTLRSTQSLDDVAEVATGTKPENNRTLDSVAAVGRETYDPSVSLGEMPNVATSDAAIIQLSDKVEHPANDSIVQNDVSEAKLTEKTMEAKMEGSSGANASKVSDSGSAAEIDESNQPGASSKDLTGQAQGELNKTDSIEMDVGNIRDVLPTPMSSGVNVLSKQDGTFTFDVRPLEGQSTEDSDKSFQQIPRIQAVMSMSGEGSPSTSGSRQKDMGIVKEISLPASSRPSSASPSEGVKSSSDHKPRRRNSKPGKESAKKGNLVKETILSQQTERLDTLSTFPSPLGAGQVMTFDGSVKPIAGISGSASSLLDPNTSGPSSAFFHQPFTDLQQVQLRAQIFVYGSLIQGAAPDEACMVSAFDGGRSVWEPSWRACIEKRRDKKYQANKTETPLQSRSGAKATDQTNTQGFTQSEVLSTPVGRTSDKAALSPLVNPIIPLPSPLWNISTPSSVGLPSNSIARFDYQGVSPLHPYQTQPLRNFVAHTTTWLSQAPYPVPWLASSKPSPFDIRASYSASPITEPVKLTPIKESSFHAAPAGNYVPNVPAIHAGAATVFAGTPTRVDLKKVAGSTSQTPAETKTRKRKKSSAADAVNIPVTVSQVDTVSTPVIANHLPAKVPAVEDLNQIPSAARNQADSVSTTISSDYSTPVTVPIASLMPKGTPNNIFSVVVPSVSSDHKRGELRVDKKALNLESFSKVEEAKLHAEQAATLAAEAVSHCQSVWSKLDQQKSVGMTTDAEAKLASAAVAIAAAASVAKAAAAAAMIASNAAAQAKQMADEAVTTHGTLQTTSYDTAFASSSGNITPLSTFLGGDSNNASTLAISAAREAARKRVEAASAASKHAENLDAIVKAAELAAEAVSQTGKIVGMGDPFSLNELVKGGLEGYWKISHMVSASGLELKDTNKSKFIGVNAEEYPTVSRNLHGGLDKDVHNTSHVVSPNQTEVPGNIVNDSTIAEENPTSVKNEGKSVKPQKNKRVVDCAEVIGSVSESDVELRSSSFITSYESNNASIKVGAAVEVLKDFGDVKKGWFSGSVLSIKDDKALVCYIELQSDEGSEPLEEWVSLESRGGKAPLIRIPHPMTALRFDGTRKRRRSFIKDYAWSVGDRVDVLVKDCWREGVITENSNSNKDPTTLTVKIPAEEELLTVKVWHVRPTLVWGDGQWSECSSRQGEKGTSQGDTPAEKRPKLGSAGVESKGKGNTARKIGFPEAGRTAEPKLPLSTNESVFDIGSMREENKVRTMRSGLQKEGPRVVFGVPKPGKKRKFMEVSKHYDSEGPNKTFVPNDSLKSAKTLMPLGFGSRSSKNNSKVDFKEKQVHESKSRAVRSGKPPVPTRPLPRKGTSTSSRPNSSNATSSNDDNRSGEQNNDSIVEETSRGTFVFSSQAPQTENRRKAVIRNTKPELLNKGKLLPSSGIGKLAKTESHEKSVSEVSEPRRSNRRIQPTSRLLEGLQSSLVIPKFPSSHEKGQRSHRGTPKRE